MISFKASYIGTSNIQIQNKNGVWSDKPSSFVRLHPQCPRDFLTIGRTAILWYKNNNARPTLASSIYNDAAYDYENLHYYALTEQQSDFEELIPEKILGFAEIKPIRKDLHEIVFLQVNPEKNYKNKNRNVKNIGSSIINALVKYFPKKNIILEPASEALNFYLKQGFKSQVMSRYLKYYV